MHFLVSNVAYLMTNNSGGCCLSDNVMHEFCVITTTVNEDFGEAMLPGYESHFELSQCKDRCSNDPFCKGFSKFSVSHNFEIFNHDGCMLYTTYNDSAFCTHNLDDSSKSTMTGDYFHTEFTLTVGQLDPNTFCAVPQDTLDRSLIDLNYYEGCHIKIKDVNGKHGFTINRCIPEDHIKIHIIIILFL